MRRVLLLLLIIVILATPFSGCGREGSSTLTPTAEPTLSFNVGDGPRGICFDGQYIWVANAWGDSVTKIHP